MKISYIITFILGISLSSSDDNKNKEIVSFNLFDKVKKDYKRILVD
jgi:hypothetical protein